MSFAKCVYCLHGVSTHTDAGCENCWCQWTRDQLLEIPGEVS